ncbi:MAG: DUF2142 domain-containing protein [Blautia sp.]|jgi:uncharacterized membrane protein
MKKKPWKKPNIPWKQILLGILIALLAGGLGEVIFNWNSLTNPNKQGSVQIDHQSIKVSGGEWKDGRFQSKGGKMTLRFALPHQYVNKLHYVYRSPGLNMDAEVIVHTEGPMGQEQKETYESKVSILRSVSVVRIDSVVDEVEIRFRAPTEGLLVEMVGISDAYSVSKMRFLFLAAAAVLIYLLVLCRESLKFRLERVFLLLALPVGLLMILGLSPREAGWDEHIHFYRAYSLMYDIMGKDTMPVTDSMYTYMTTGMANQPFYFPRSQEENAQEREYGEKGWHVDSGGTKVYQETNGLHLYSVAYLPQTLFLALGLLFHVPFWLLVAMGRAGNLIFYCLLCYLAIRHMKRGKGLVTVIALLPTSVFLAATFSYDAFINGCILLGMAYLFTEVAEKDRPVSMKNLAVFAVFLVLGSLPKAVYIPLILLGFLLPAKRFENPKAAKIFKGVLILLMLLLMATFVMPVAGGGEVAGDPRGGDTSATRQLALIFSHPLGYASLALSSIWENLMGFLFGQSVAGNLAYRGALTWGAWVCPFVVFAIFTGEFNEDGKGLGKWQRLFTGILVFGVIGLIWTALYLSFTPVGASVINGVQARYYIPLLLPAYLALQCAGIRNKMPVLVYHRILMGGSLLFLLDALWTGVICRCF